MIQFLMVYIREAHPDDGWSGKPVGIHDPKTIEERRALAETCEVAMQYGIQTYVDELDDGVMTEYAAWPERLYLIGEDGRVAYAGERGPWGFSPIELRTAIENTLRKK